ncbi:Uncharacterised protein [Enterobacter cloacae]|nr:Uncharacterised protein [Enterobacter cloacae]
MISFLFNAFFIVLVLGVVAVVLIGGNSTEPTSISAERMRHKRKRSQKNDS